jgi:DNA gyrase subunit A
MGRATQGVKLINLKANDSIAAVAKVMHEEDEEIQDDAINEVLRDNSENQSDEPKSEESTSEE